MAVRYMPTTCPAPKHVGHPALADAPLQVTHPTGSTLSHAMPHPSQLAVAIPQPCNKCPQPASCCHPSAKQCPHPASCCHASTKQCPHPASCHASTKQCPYPASCHASTKQCLHKASCHASAMQQMPPPSHLPFHLAPLPFSTLRVSSASCSHLGNTSAPSPVRNHACTTLPSQQPSAAAAAARCTSPTSMRCPSNSHNASDECERWC